MLKIELDKSSSRYKFTQLVYDSEIKGKRYSLFKPPKFRNNFKYTTYVVQKKDLGRLDNLAYKFYNDSRLWWVIAYINHIGNQLTDMKVGDVLKIPLPEEVAFALNNEESYS